MKERKERLNRLARKYIPEVNVRGNPIEQEAAVTQQWIIDAHVPFVKKFRPTGPLPLLRLRLWYPGRPQPRGRCDTLQLVKQLWGRRIAATNFGINRRKAAYATGKDPSSSFHYLARCLALNSFLDKLVQRY